MLKKKIWKFLLLGAVVALVLFGANYLRYERHPLPQALAALESDNIMTVTRQPMAAVGRSFIWCWRSVCLGDVPRQTGSPNQGQHLCVFSFSMEYCYLQPCLFRI
jgi:hypothetical protein